MLAVLELTPRFKKLKRRASLEFCVHLDMSPIEILNGVSLNISRSKMAIE